MNELRAMRNSLADAGRRLGDLMDEVSGLPSGVGGFASTLEIFQSARRAMEDVDEVLQPTAPGPIPGAFVTGLMARFDPSTRVSNLFSESHEEGANNSEDEERA